VEIKVWSTANIVSSGIIEETKGHRLTGRPDWIRVRGKKANITLGPGEWHETLEAAVETARRDIKRALDANGRMIDDLVQRRLRLEKIYDSFKKG
jgi:hypothetical protein